MAKVSHSLPRWDRAALGIEVGPVGPSGLANASRQRVQIRFVETRYAVACVLRGERVGAERRPGLTQKFNYGANVISLASLSDLKLEEDVSCLCGRNVKAGKDRLGGPRVTGRAKMRVSAFDEVEDTVGLDARVSECEEAGFVYEGVFEARPVFGETDVLVTVPSRKSEDGGEDCGVHGRAVDRESRGLFGKSHDISASGYGISGAAPRRLGICGRGGLMFWDLGRGGSVLGGKVTRGQRRRGFRVNRDALNALAALGAC